MKFFAWVFVWPALIVAAWRYMVAMSYQRFLTEQLKEDMKTISQGLEKYAPVESNATKTPSSKPD